MPAAVLLLFAVQRVDLVADSLFHRFDLFNELPGGDPLDTVPKSCQLNHGIGGSDTDSVIFADLIGQFLDIEVTGLALFGIGYMDAVVFLRASLISLHKIAVKDKNQFAAGIAAIIALRPLESIIVPRVAINAGSLSFATRSPLIKPNNVPIAIITGMVAQRGIPSI